MLLQQKVILQKYVFIVTEIPKEGRFSLIYRKGLNNASKSKPISINIFFLKGNWMSEVRR